MIYRKSPPHPPRMLLRVVAAAGASAVVVGAGACGSSAGPGTPGLVDYGADAVSCANGCGLVDGSGDGFHPQDAGGDGDASSPADAHGTEGGEAGGDAAAD